MAESMPPQAPDAQPPTPYYSDEFVTLYHGDCREILPHLSFDAIVSDPPYGMEYQHGARKGGQRMGMDGESIEGDFEPFDPSHLRDGRPANDQSDCELAWTNFLRTARVHSQFWSGNVRTGREQQEGRLHVNQKPVALMHWCLDLLGKMGVILDPYAGSGTTLVAARERGQKAIGIEYELKHCKTIVGRLDQGVLDFGGVA